LGSRKSIRLVKMSDDVSGARCNIFVYNVADTTATPSSVACLVPAYPGCPGKKAIK